MMKMFAVAALVVAVPSAAFAGDDGDRCAIRQFGGEWLTAVSMPIGGVDTDLACRIAVDRVGQITASTCIKDNVTATSFSIAGSFATALNCRIKGTLTVDGNDLTIDGELGKSRDVLAGLVYGSDGAFKPIVLLRSAEWRPGKPPKPEDPGKDKKGGKD